MIKSVRKRATINHSSLFNRTFIAQAPAKVNLSLRITGRRDDGFHLLQMVNAPLALHDTVTLRLHAKEEISLAVDGPCVDPEDFALLSPDKNLAGRAFTAFCREADLDLGVQIQLHKQIPVGAGLGGGSSDGATVLRLLHNLFPERIDSDTLSQIALSLGSDLPYLLEPRLAQVSGIGETVEPLSDCFFVRVPVIVLMPPALSVSSAAVYDQFRSDRPHISDSDDSRSIATVLSEIANGNRSEQRAGFQYGAMLEFVGNDLTETVTAMYPEVSELLAQAQAIPGAVAGLTGSGAAIFVLPMDIAATISALGKKIQQCIPNTPFRAYPTALLANFHQDGHYRAVSGW